MTRSGKTTMLACGIVLFAAGALFSIAHLRGDEDAATSRPAAAEPTAAAVLADVDLPVVTAHMTPTCLCCGDWADHMKRHGFHVEIRYTDDLPAVKAEHGVPAELTSCHTAVVDGYILEGHIPADVIQQFLQERPRVLGLAVPGMPRGSPGMEVPGPPDRYQVVTFDEDGNRTVYAER